MFPRAQTQAMCFNRESTEMKVGAHLIRGLVVNSSHHWDESSVLYLVKVVPARFLYCQLTTSPSAVDK